MSGSKHESAGEFTAQLRPTGVDLSRIADATFTVTVIEGPDCGTTFRLDGSTASRVLVGKGPACEFQLNDPTVSGRHIALDIQGSRVRITDLQSTNGTVVDGIAVLDAFIAGGETITIGRTRLKLELAADPPELQLSNEAAFGPLLGASVEMRRLFPLCARLAQADVPLIIEGETGTGKEILAEALHQQGPRASGPFVIFDCTAVPPALLEAELFGHETGAYPGAGAARAGVFEQADGGTLFIDEIGELELSLQPKLLRAIERQEVRRLGGNDWHHVDVRIIAATRRDLDRAVQLQRFRDDLFHRLAVTRIELPPLRDRKGDIPMLAQHFARNIGNAESTIPRAVLSEWAEASWPGNVRELRNAVARYLALGEFAEHNASASQRSIEPSSSSGAGEMPEPTSSLSQTEWLSPLFALPLSEARQRVVDEFEREYVKQVLARHGGNVTHAAAAAGVVRRHFQTLKARALK